MALIEPSDWQAGILRIPDNLNLAIFGGRGAGRTTATMLASALHCDLYGEKAHVLLTRQTLRSFKEVEDMFQFYLAEVYKDRGGIKVNRQDHFFGLPGGATIEFGPIDDTRDMEKLQGRSFSLIIADEYGNFTPPQVKFIDQLRANLRAGDVNKGGAPTRMILLANPGGRAHQTIVQRYISKMQPGVPTILEDGKTWVLCPATYKNNPHLPPDYDKDLFASALKDKELFRAWAEGAWNIARGAMFADCISESEQLISCSFKPPIVDAGPKNSPAATIVHYRGQTVELKRRPGLYGFVCCDWGQSSPAVAFACWKLLEPVGPFPRGSILIVDEVSSSAPDDRSVGMNWSVGKLAEAIIEMCDRCGIHHVGTIDDAKGLQPEDTLIKGMAKYQLAFVRPKKNRTSGWALMREYLTNSYERNGRPGLWVADRCRGYWETVPLVPRDPLRPEDVDTRTVDHWADTTRYGCTYEVQQANFNTPTQTLKKYGVGGAAVTPQFIL